MSFVPVVCYKEEERRVTYEQGSIMGLADSLIKAEQDGAVWVDCKPDKVLRPIGTIFKEWNECISSTELPHWVVWKVVGHVESVVSLCGGTLLFERYEEVALS